MIPKLTQGSGFRGVLDYCFAPNDWKGSERGDAPVLVGGNMAGTTPRQLAAEFALARQLRPDVKKPVLHVSLSLAPGETLSPEQWHQAARLVLEKVGRQIQEANAKGTGGSETAIDPDHFQWCLVRHAPGTNEAGKDHCHLIFNRISITGELAYLKWSHNRFQQACREVEQELGLVQVTTSEKSKQRQERRRSRRQKAKEAIEGGEPVPQVFQQGEDRSASRDDLAQWARLKRGEKEIPANLQSRVDIYWQQRQESAAVIAVKTRIRRSLEGDQMEM